MEDRRQAGGRQGSATRLTASTSKVGQRQATCQNCGRSGECGCTQPIKSGSAGKIETTPVKSPLKTLALNQNVREAVKRASGKLPPSKPKTVAPETTSLIVASTVEPALQDVCLIHNKPLDVICKEDLTIICASCAIFGHKGHDFKSVNEFQLDKLKRCQDILELTDDRRVLEENIGGRSAKESLEKEFYIMKEKLVEEAKDHFKKLMTLVQIGQEKCIERILIAVTVEYDKLKEQLAVPHDLLNRYRQWEVHAYEEIKAFENDQNVQLQMKMLNYDSKLQEDIVKKGNSIMSEFKHYHQVLRNSITEGLGCLSLNFPKEVEKKLEKYSDFSVKRKAGGVNFPSDMNVPSSDDLLLNDSKVDLDENKESEMQPTRKVLKMQEQLMKIEQESAPVVVIPPIITQEATILPTQLPTKEESLLKKEQSSPRTTTDNNIDLLLPNTSRIVERKTMEIKENRSSIIDTRKNESFCPTPSSSCISPLYRPRMTTLDSEKQMNEYGLPSTTLIRQNSKSMLRIVTSPDKFSSWPSVRSIMSPTKHKDLTNEQRIKRVLQKLKLPEKYQKMVTSLMTESLEVLDLSSCSIDQTQILCVVELLKVNHSVRTVKLIRNRLTDDFVERMLPFLSGVTSLNLSQNYLTERTLDYIMAVTNQLPLLRNVVLSQNRIREKTCRSKLDELRKMNISVSF